MFPVKGDKHSMSRIVLLISIALILLHSPIAFSSDKFKLCLKNVLADITTSHPARDTLIQLEHNISGKTIAGKIFLKVENDKDLLTIPQAVDITQGLFSSLQLPALTSDSLSEIFITNSIKSNSLKAYGKASKIYRYEGSKIVIDLDPVNNYRRIYLDRSLFDKNLKPLTSNFNFSKKPIVLNSSPIPDRKLSPLIKEKPSVFSGGLISISGEPPEGFFAASTSLELERSLFKAQNAKNADVWLYRVPDSRDDSYFRFYFPSPDRPNEFTYKDKFKIATGLGPANDPKSIGGKEANLLWLGDEQQGALSSYLDTISSKNIRPEDLYKHQGYIQKISDNEVYIGNAEQSHRLTQEGFNSLKTHPDSYRKIYSVEYDNYLKTLYEISDAPQAKSSYLLATSRGCSQGCALCCSGGIKKFQYFSATRMMDELEKIAAHAQIGHNEFVDVFFLDSNFNNHPDRIIEFAKLYESSSLKGKFRFSIRHSSVNGFLLPEKNGVRLPNLELIEAYKKLGTKLVSMGADTFDDASTLTLKTNKLQIASARPTYRFSEFSALAEAMERSGIHAKAFYLTNNPWISDLDRIDSYYNVLEVWLKNPHFSIDSARDREVLRLKPFEGSPIAKAAAASKKKIIRNGHFIAEGHQLHCFELMSFKRLGVPQFQSNATDTIAEFKEGINKIKGVALKVIDNPKSSQNTKHQAQLILNKIEDRTQNLSHILNKNPATSLHLTRVSPKEQSIEFAKKSQPLFNSLLPNKQSKIAPGYLQETKKLDLSGVHTIANIPSYLQDNLGKELLEKINHSNEKVFLFLGEGSSALDSIERLGWKIESQVQKREGFHQIYHGKNKEGQSAYFITRINGNDRQVHIESLLRLANLPEDRVATLGNSISWKRAYSDLFKRLGYIPDGVIYGFQGTVLNGIMSETPIKSLPSYLKFLHQRSKERHSIRDLTKHDLSALPMAVVEFKDGKKIWVFKNVYGDLSDQLFEALEDHGVKNYLYAGTAGSLDETKKVGDFVSPQKYLNPKTGAEEKLDWLKRNSKIPNEGTYTRVSTPNVETHKWLSSQKEKNVSIIDVELGYFLERMKKNNVNAQVTLMISDVLSGKNAKDLTQWGLLDQQRSTFTLKPIVKNMLGYSSDTPMTVKNYKSVSILPDDGNRGLISHYMEKLLSGNIGLYTWDSNKIALRILQAKTRIHKELIPLSDLSRLHEIRTAGAIEKKKQRVIDLRVHTDEVVQTQAITYEMQRRFLPSFGPMKAVQDTDGKYYIWDGNGRLEAIREAFDDYPDLKVEIEIYDIESSDVLKAIHEFKERNHGVSIQKTPLSLSSYFPHLKEHKKISLTLPYNPLSLLPI